MVKSCHQFVGCRQLSITGIHLTNVRHSVCRQNTNNTDDDHQLNQGKSAHRFHNLTYISNEKACQAVYDDTQDFRDKRFVAQVMGRAFENCGTIGLQLMRSADFDDQGRGGRWWIERYADCL
jgi:hypothetical protein